MGQVGESGRQGSSKPELRQRFLHDREQRGRSLRPTPTPTRATPARVGAPATRTHVPIPRATKPRNSAYCGDEWRVSGARVRVLLTAVRDDDFLVRALFRTKAGSLIMRSEYQLSGIGSGFGLPEFLPRCQILFILRKQNCGHSKERSGNDDGGDHLLLTARHERFDFLYLAVIQSG